MAGFGKEAFLKASNEKEYLTEVGPRLNFSTAWSTNAISIFHACGLTNIPRAECSRRYLLHCTEPLTEEEKIAFTSRIGLDWIGLALCLNRNLYTNFLNKFN